MPTQIPVQPKASWMAETARYIDFLAAGGGHHQRVAVFKFTTNSNLLD
jgi:hypothetical protein